MGSKFSQSKDFSNNATCCFLLSVSPIAMSVHRLLSGSVHPLLRHRCTYLQNREYLRQLSPENAAALEVVESAVCHAVLETVPGLNRDRTLRLNLCGDGASRWADKSLTAVAYTDGYGGNYCDVSLTVGRTCWRGRGVKAMVEKLMCMSGIAKLYECCQLLC